MSLENDPIGYEQAKRMRERNMEIQQQLQTDQSPTLAVSSDVVGGLPESSGLGRPQHRKKSTGLLKSALKKRAEDAAREAERIRKELEAAQRQSEVDVIEEVSDFSD